VRYDLVNPADGDPGVCGGTVHLYLEPYMPTPTLYVIGCGHVGRKVVELAHWLGFRVVAFDDRPDHVTDDAVPLADARLSGSLAAALEAHPVTPETHVVVVTRNMGLDLTQLPLLVTTPARTIGVMGSRRRWEETRAKLEAQGVDRAALERVRSPIGVEIDAETPEEIAVSILAQIVAERRGAG
jgi:xanthine dehydrogenase accessory factor